MIVFNADDHSYRSVDDSNIDWISVTTLVSHFKKPFDAKKVSEKVSKSKRSKWFGIDPVEIQRIWAGEGDRAVTAGSWYHDEREADITSINTIQRSGVEIPIIKPIWEGNIKYAPNQRLTEGIYPEHFVYLKSAGVCGQSDRVEVVKGVVDVIDYKTNKEIKKNSFVNWEGKSQKMTGPLSHLDDCNFNHYALQLSTYMYIILKHNPQYKAGKQMLHHVIFEKEAEDEFGYPITKKDSSGNPIVKTVVPYEVPYLKSEVIAMIDYLKNNPK